MDADSGSNMKQPNEFQIPPGEYPDLKKTLDRIEQAMLAQSASNPDTVVHSIPANIVKGLAVVATELWKARGKTIDPTSGEVRDEMKRVHRHIDKALESLREIGLETRDDTGKVFDYGLPLRVVTTQPMPGIQREKIIETLRPTVLWKAQIIQMGEVVIAVPAPSEPAP